MAGAARQTASAGQKMSAPKMLRRSVIITGMLGMSLMNSGPLLAVTISGTVKTTTGKLIVAAITIHDLSTARVAGQAPYDHQFASKADGTFTLSGVPPGKYEFCVDAPQAQVLDPCIWTPAGAPTLTVAATAAVTKYAITVDTGYLLQLRVNDP